MRERGLRIVVYLDDFLILIGDKEGASHDFQMVVNLVSTLGFTVNWEKSSSIPEQSLEYLEMIVDSSRLSFKHPAQKIHSLESLLSQKAHIS